MLLKSVPDLGCQKGYWLLGGAKTKLQRSPSQENGQTSKPFSPTRTNSQQIEHPMSSNGGDDGAQVVAGVGGKRTRAKQACLSCSARRVRCNVTDVQPCANCATGGLVCEVVPSKRGKYVPATHTPTTVHGHGHGNVHGHRWTVITSDVLWNDPWI